MMKRIAILSFLLVIAFFNCDGITDELTPKQRCYKQRSKVVDEGVLRGPCDYALIEPAKDSTQVNPVETLRNTALAYCLYQETSRRACERLDY
jgi:hypothetical protein